jgi:hypothetical protein
VFDGELKRIGTRSFTQLGEQRNVATANRLKRGAECAEE